MHQQREIPTRSWKLKLPWGGGFRDHLGSCAAGLVTAGFKDSKVTVHTTE